MCVLHLLAMFILNKDMLLSFFSTMSSVYAFVLLCLYSGIEQIDMSAFSVNNHLLLSVLSIELVCSHNIW